MKPFLVITQAIYVLCIAVWFFVWMMSFMLFDTGIHVWNSFFFALISLFPVVVGVSAIFAWFFQARKRRTAILFNLIPMLWIIAFVVIMLVA